MIPDVIDGALAALGPTSATLGYFVVIGVAMRLVARRWVVLPRGLGLTAGLGLALAVVAASLSYLVAGRVSAPILPLLIFAGLVILAAGVRALVVRRGGSERRPGAGVTSLIPLPSDALALAVAFVALGTILRFGLTYWTSGTNDFPSYAASAQVWLSDNGHGPTFAESHPDAFGAAQGHRAFGEKPMATALLVVAGRVSGIAPYALLTPVMLVSIFILVSVLFTIVRGLFRDVSRIGYLAVLVPTFSIVPMSRVFDAQLGQVLAVAMAALVVAILAAVPPPEGRAGRWVLAAVAGIAMAACLGSNPTLVLGTSPMVAALAYWLARRLRVSGRALAMQWVRALAVAAVLSVSFAGRYATSVRGQTAGGEGFDIPLAGPLSLIGLQGSLTAAPGSREVLLQWGVLLGVAACGYLAYKRIHPGLPATAVLVLLTLANGAYTVVAQGFDSYVTHKWLAVAVALVAPLLLVRLLEQVPREARGWIGVMAAGLTVCSAAVSWVAGGSVKYVIPDDLLALADDARITDARIVNINLGNIYENSTAPLILDAETIIVTGQTYARPTTPVGDWMLVHRSDEAAWSYDEAIELNDGYALVDLDLEVGAGTIAFGEETPRNRSHLYGVWYPTEAGGTWSTGTSASIVVDLPDELRGEDVSVTLEGMRFATPESPRTLTVAVDGQELATADFDRRTGDRQVRFTIPGELTTADDGRLVVQLLTPDLISPADLGEPDTRRLGFWLTELTIAPAGS